MITAAKGITNGCVPMGVVLVSDDVHDAFMPRARTTPSTCSMATPIPAIRWPAPRRIAADGATALAGNAHLGELHAAPVQHQQPPGQRGADAAQQLDRLGRLQGADDAHQRREHPHGGAAPLLEGGASGGNTQA
jgi:hypothetical protein